VIIFKCIDNFNNTVLFRFYTSLIESVLSYNCITWWHSLSKLNQNRVNRICKHASKVIGLPISSIDDLWNGQFNMYELFVFITMIGLLKYCVLDCVVNCKPPA
jgi:hypothetical protein